MQKEKLIEGYKKAKWEILGVAGGVAAIGLSALASGLAIKQGDSALGLLYASSSLFGLLHVSQYGDSAVKMASRPEPFPNKASDYYGAMAENVRELGKRDRGLWLVYAVSIGTGLGLLLSGAMASARGDAAFGLSGFSLGVTSLNCAHTITLYAMRRGKAAKPAASLPSAQPA